MEALTCDRLRALVEKLPARVSRLTADGRFVWFNRELREYFGIGDTPARMHSVASIMGEAYAEAQTPYVMRVLAGETVHFYPRVPTKGGQDVASVTFIPDVETNGAITGYFSFAVDVTEHHRARAAEKILAAALRNVSEGVVLYDSQDRLAFANDTARGLMADIGATAEVGTTFEEVIRKYTSRYMADKSREESEAYVRRRLEQHRKPNGLVEVDRGPGWILVHEHRTERGETLCIYTDVTELKKRELALERAERRYAVAAEAAHTGVWEWNLDRGEVFVDPALKRLIGYDDDEVGTSAEQWLGHIHPEDRDRLIEAAERHLRGETSEFAFEHRKRHKDGSVRCFMSRGRALPDPDGNTRRLIGADVDITERKRVEDDLSASEERYRTLLEAFPEGIAVTRGAGIVFANAAAARMHGLKGSEALIGKRFVDTLHPDEHERNLVLKEKVFGDGEGFVGEPFRHLRLDTGAEVVTEDSCYRIRWQGADAALLIMRDVTERRLAEQALRESEERYRTLVSLLPDAVVVSRGGEIVFANRGAAVLHGAASADDLIGTPFDDLIHPDFRADVAVRRHMLATRRRPLPLAEHIHLKRNGDEFAVEKTGQGILWQGKPASLIVIRDITERKRAERELRESERQVRLITDNVPAMICHIGKDLKFHFANQYYADWTGMPLDDIVGHSLPDVIGQREYDATNGYRRRALAGAEVTFRGSRVINGDNRQYRATYIPHLDDANVVQGYFALIIDLTEEERMAEALRESESLLRLVADNIPTPVGYVDSEGRYKFVSKQYEDWLQMPREEILGALNWDVRACGHHPAERERMRQTYRAEVEEALKGHPVAVYGERTYPDGIHRHVRKSRVPDVDENGRVRGVFILISDISEIKESEALLTLIMDNVPALIAYLEPDGRYKYVSKQYEEWFGVAREEIVGKIAWDFLVSNYCHEDKERIRAVLRDELERALAGEFVIVDSARHYPGETSHRFVRKVMIPDLRDGGTTRGVFSHVSDITALKRHEEALREARDEAELANRSKSRFLASASHDLRQPLQALNLLTFALAESMSSQEDKHLVDDMRQALNVMENVLNALIDISKLDAGVVVPEIQDVPLAGLCRQIRASFDVQARQKGLELRIMPCDYAARTDPELLSRILDNFVSNAIKYTDRGRVLMGVRRAGPNLKIEVHDTGRGIPPEELEGIFEEFYQLDNPARDRNKGLGLGLAIVRRTANLLNHPIDARSLPGHGSTFSVIVPLGYAHVGDHQEFYDVDPVGDLSGYDILVVEDDETVRLATERILRRWGVEVATADSTEKALAQIGEHGFSPDLIIADYNLPGHQTGTRAIAAIRERMGYQVAGIIITGDIAADRMTEAQEAKLQVLQKPVDPSLLRRLIGSLIEEPAL